MPTLTELHRAVQVTLAAKRIGTPVFVRYTVQGADLAEAILRRLTALTELVRDWLSQDLERLQAVGTLASGQVSVMLQFREGATAQLSFAHVPLPRPVVDLIVLGNHGVIYHDAASADSWAEVGLSSHDLPAIRAAIEQALRSGKPERVSQGAVP